MIIPVRLWDKRARRMIYPEEGSKVGIFLTMSGRAVQYKPQERTFAFLPDVEVLLMSSLETSDKKKLFDQDICDFDIPNEYGSAVKGRGVVNWQDGWAITVVQPQFNSPQDFGIQNVKLVGNVKEHAQLLMQKP